MGDNLVIEQRPETMVTPIGSHSHFRTSHILTPTVTTVDGPVAAPSLHPSSSAAVKHKHPPLKLNFRGWRKHPYENWKTWAHKMRAKHHSTWKKAGIHDAILNSTFHIHRHDDLIFGFVEKWCPTTNTFVFPWGEATVTLEDMIVLGGYSVSGEYVSTPPENEEIEETGRKLFTVRSEFMKSKSKRPSQSLWINKFMGSESEIEHEAFLTYWLSKFVFPLWKDTIGSSVVSIAVRLARGTKIALASAVLAGIYSSLSLLKKGVVSARKSRGNKNQEIEIVVSFLLALVQVWVWERFPSLRPNPNSVAEGEPRLTKWHNMEKSKIGEISMEIDCAAESFKWRPYSAVLGKIYMVDGYWAFVESDLDEDLEGFIRCVRTSELVGLKIGCIEQYLPHRVSMQFGMDQDLPGHVKRVNRNAEIAWRNYIRPIGDVRVYVPGRAYKPGVTTRYFSWWKNLSKSDFVRPSLGFSPKLKSDDNSSNRERPSGASPSISSGGKGVEDSSIGKDSSEILKRRLVLTSSSDDDDDADVLGRGKVVVEFSDNESCGNSQSIGEGRKRLKRVDEGASSDSEQVRDERHSNFTPRETAKRQNHSISRQKGSLKSLKRRFVESSSSDDNDPVFSRKHRKTESVGILGSEKLVVELSGSESDGNSQSRDEAQDEGGDRLASTKYNGDIEEATLPVEGAECEAKNTIEKEDLEGWIEDGMKSTSGDMENVVIGLEERIRNIEKLCNSLQSGKLKISLKPSSSKRK